MNLQRTSRLVLLLVGCWLTACSDDDGQNQNQNAPDADVPVEICDDGQDNDGDGAVDCADPDCSAAPGCQAAPARRITLLMTSDLYDHADGVGAFAAYTPGVADSDPVQGGYPRLATLIRTVRAEQAAKGIPLLTFDAGDFVMGTVHDVLMDRRLSLAFFTEVGYDAITLGNHEFEYGLDHLAGFLARDMTVGGSPVVVESNLLLSATDPSDDALEALVASGLIVPDWLFPVADDLTVGVLGRVGTFASSDLRGLVTFDNDTERWQARVDDLRSRGADLVVLLSHGGVYAIGTGDDIDLAINVTGIDVIVSGHTDSLAEPLAVQAGDHVTWIVAQVTYGATLSRLDLGLDLAEDRLTEFAYTLVQVDDTVPGDATVMALVDAHRALVDERLLASSIASASASPIAETAVTLPFSTALEESGVALLSADALRFAATRAVQGTAEATPFDLALQMYPRQGILHDGGAGIVTVADAFALHPMFFSPDPEQQELPGSPVTSVYVTAAEIAEMAEISASVAPFVGDYVYYMFFAGVRMEYDPTGPLLQRVTRVWRCGNTLPAEMGGDGDVFSTRCDEELDLADEVTLYRGTVMLWMLQSLWAASDYGLIIRPKRADGSLIDMNDLADVLSTRIDEDPATPGLQELKAWMTPVSFLREALSDDGGLPGLNEIPADVYGPGGTAFGRLFSL